MVTKTKTDLDVDKKAASKETAIVADPFASLAEEIPVKKPAAKKVGVSAKAKTTKVSAAVKPAKKVGKVRKTIDADPFADLAAGTSPIKKSSPKALTAESKAPKKAVKQAAKKLSLDVTVELATAKPKVALSPTFKALADVTLPKLERENRARLQMQTPTRLYFYWSLKDNPWAKLRSVFGDDMGSYSLVLKLVDKKTGFEKIDQTDVEGNYWFDVEPDGSYEAEIGFYAPNRPYFRILHSNAIQTPRRSPSPRAATDADWKVSASKFAEVLDVAGFTRDAFDVALAGDDPVAAVNTSHVAIASFLGIDVELLAGISAEDVRYALLALASGAKLEDLRFKISSALFAILQANAERLVADQAMNALSENYDVEETEYVEEQLGGTVYGASVVNFPRTLRTRVASNMVPRSGPLGAKSDYAPISSHSFR